MTLNNKPKDSKKKVITEKEINITSSDCAFDTSEEKPGISSEIIGTPGSKKDSEKKLSLFNLYKLAIEKGYTYEDTRPSIATCSYACKNALTIEPNGQCSICSCMSEFGLKAGYINDNGNLILKNEAEYLKIKNLLATDREMCKKCKKLPLCMGGCSYARYKDNNFCDKNGSEGLSIDQRIILHYLYDLQSTSKIV